MQQLSRPLVVSPGKKNHRQTLLSKKNEDRMGSVLQAEELKLLVDLWGGLWVEL